VGLTLNNLGVLLHDLEAHDRSEEAYRRALTILEGTLGEDHPHVEACRENLADLLEDRGRSSS